MYLQLGNTQYIHLFIQLLSQTTYKWKRITVQVSSWAGEGYEHSGDRGFKG